MLDAAHLKLDFPLLARTVHGKPLVYLDSAATSQKPQTVIDAIVKYYQTSNANVHRGVHQLGDESTQAFHTARHTIATFFGAQPEELLIVRNTTEALNQVAYAWGNAHVGAGDVVMVSQLEHHSNLVPWQELVRRQQAQLVFVPVTAAGEIDLTFLENFDFEHRPVKILALSHVSNTLGSVTPVERVVRVLRQRSPQTKIVIDGAQAAPHLPIRFDALDVDFYAVSAHKMLGPMGIGGLLVKKNIISHLSPFLFGGGMIAEVSEQSTTFAEDMEERFTAGTPDVAGLVGWAAACEYLQKIGMEQVANHDQQLVNFALKQLSQLPELQLLGPLDSQKRVGSVTFLYKSVHAHDVGQVLDSEGVAVRSGHHCTMPLHTKFGWQATVRASFNVYTTLPDIEALVIALQKVKKVFGT